MTLPPTITATEIARVLRLSVDEFYEVIKQHADFPTADASGLYSRAEVLSYMDRVFKAGRIGAFARRNGAGSLN
jgi:hypothetical protein